MMTTGHLVVWIIVAAATAGVIARPFRLPEAVWAVGGAAILVATGELSWREAGGAVGKGRDVYLFLAGMMLLSETARRTHVFDWAAAVAVTASRGSKARLFDAVYCVGVGVTTLLSNDATAVVLTPAVFAVTRRARVDPAPYLFVCAFVANAASFVLPISNPANLVLYGARTPPLARWITSFGLASVASILATYVVLRWCMRARLRGACEDAGARTPLSAAGWTALGGVAATAGILAIVSACDLGLGPPTFLLGVLTTAAVLVQRREAPWATLRGVPWAVLVLVGGLFVLVQALDRTGVVDDLAAGLHRAADLSIPWAAVGAGAGVAFVSNLTNNLPAGLIVAEALSRAHPPQPVVDSLLIGVDLGPNLSITGSLATILWLAAIRREGEAIGFWRFLKLGAVVTPPALALAIGARLFAS